MIWGNGPRLRNGVCSCLFHVILSPWYFQHPLFQNGANPLLNHNFQVFNMWKGWMINTSQFSIAMLEGVLLKLPPQAFEGLRSHSLPQRHWLENQRWTWLVRELWRRQTQVTFTNPTPTVQWLIKAVQWGDGLLAWWSIPPPQYNRYRYLQYLQPLAPQKMNCSCVVHHDF